MYPVTDEVKALFESEQRKVLRITGTDRNGATISITDDNVIEDSFQIDRYSCNGEKLEIGTAIAGQLTLKLENGNGQYDGIVFEGAELFVEVGIADWTQSSPTVTYIPCGYFTPDEQPRRLSTISITALDRMMRFDAVSLTKIPWTTRSGEVITTDSGEPIYFVKSIRFPCTISQIVAQAATICNVPFTQDLSGFPNANISIQELPVPNKDLTYRTLIQWCAAIMGCNAWIDWTGAMRFSWYENTTDYVSTIDNRYSSDLYENDLSITGVAYTNNSGIQFVEGSADYTVDIVGNLLIGAQVATMLPAIAAALNGFTYRPFTAAAVNAPYLWPMDVITFRDKEGNDHTSALTNVAFGLNGTTAMESKGMTYAINRGVQPSGFTKEQAQLVNEVKQSIVDLDDSLTQEEIFNRLTDNGETQGLILYNGKLYLNAEYIQAGTLVANLLLASILSIGGTDNGNGGLRILDGDGNVIGTWNKNGITVSKGSITGGTINGAILTLGGSDNTSGTLTVKDGSGNTVATIDNAGVSVSKGNIAGPTVSLGGVDNQSGVLRIYDILGNEFGVFNNSGLALTTSPVGRPTIRVTKTSSHGTETVTIGENSAVLDIDIDLNSAFVDRHITFDSSGMTMDNGDGETARLDIDRLNLTSGDNLGAPAITLTDTGENTRVRLSADSGLVFFNGNTSKTSIGEADAYFAGPIRFGDPATTRTNLGVTPANIGAVSLDGNDTKDGNLTLNGDLAVNADYYISLLSDATITIGDDYSKIVKDANGDVTMQTYSGASVTVTDGGNVEIQSDSGEASITLDANGDIEVTGFVKDKRILQAASAVSIPSVGNTVTVNITGLTDDHQLVCWNFSDSPENAPPADLEWETWDGYFTVTNHGGTTSESITPVFILPE